MHLTHRKSIRKDFEIVSKIRYNFFSNSFIYFVTWAIKVEALCFYVHLTNTWKYEMIQQYYVGLYAMWVTRKTSLFFIVFTLGIFLSFVSTNSEHNWTNPIASWIHLSLLFYSIIILLQKFNLSHHINNVIWNSVKIVVLRTHSFEKKYKTRRHYRA